jgi:prevent-host-death family protein
MKISTKELRTHTKQMLDSVNRGEEVIITYRGHPKARVVPLDQGSGVAEETELFGIWRDYETSTDVESFMDELRRSRF